jgi:hypothetical protein
MCASTTQVLKVIRTHAFDVGSFPLFLSLELNLDRNSKQQEVLAQMLQEAFGDIMLDGTQGRFIDKLGISGARALVGRREIAPRLPSLASLCGKVVIFGSLPKVYGQKLRDLYHMECYRVREGAWRIRNLGESDLVASFLDLEKHRATTEHNLTQLTRVYPKGLRLDSSNMDPCLAWSAGCQMACLNLETPGRAMDVNTARFREFGWCGFTPRPEFIVENPGVSLRVRVICAVNLSSVAGETDNIDPYCVLTLEGHEGDRVTRTGAIIRNAGSYAYWDQTFHFKVRFWDQAILVVEVKDKDFLTKDDPMGNAAVSLRSLRMGPRAMCLQQDGKYKEGSILLAEFSTEPL